MADITISSGTIRISNSPRPLGYIGVFPASDFWLYAYRSPIQISTGGLGAENGANPYMLVPLTPTGTNPTVYTYPSFSIPSTEDAVINSNGARWCFAIMDDATLPRFIMYIAQMQSVRIPASPSTNNLTDIAGYNLSSDPPVTNGDRIIYGDLYAVDGNFSGIVTAVGFVGDGSGLTGIAAGTGGVTNTGSTTIGADTDSDGTGIVSLQTRTIERLAIANDGSVTIAQTLTVAGLSTFSLGASIPGAKQLSWTTANVAAPSLTDNTIGSRIKIHDGAAPDHTAIGLESGAGWFNTADANAWKFYYAAVLKHTLTKDIFSLNGALHFLSGATSRARIEASASDRLLFEKGDGTELLRIDGGGNGTLTAPNALFSIGSSTLPIGVIRAGGSGGYLMYDGAANVLAGIKAPAGGGVVQLTGTGTSVGAALQLVPTTTTPANPSASSEGNIYIKGGMLVIQYNDATVIRWKYLDLTGTGVTWVHAVVAP